MYKLLFSCFLYFLSLNSFAQETLKLSNSSSIDTLAKKTTLVKPKRALLYSTLVPGMGQVYNKKYWKVPVIYTLLSGGVAWFIHNNNNYNRFKNAYIKLENNETVTDPKVLAVFPQPSLSKSRIFDLQDNYHRTRDLSGVLIITVYALNIIDAYVDAHLSTFDVNDNLALNVSPIYTPKYALNSNTSAALGLNFRLYFK